LGLIIRRTPSWAPWATIAVGLFVSWFVMNVFTADVCAGLFGIDSLTKREIIDMNIILTVAGHVFITGGFFWATTLFYKEEKDKNKLETDKFFKNLETPVFADDLQYEADRQQRLKLGGMVMIMSSGILLMIFIPNPLWGRILFVCCALGIFSIGFLLRRSAKSKASSNI
jgi:SSS family solute:Na+ symporter